MSSTSSSGRGRAIALTVLVAVLAVVAAVVTVVVSQKTYSPTVRQLSAKTQVAAGAEYTDEMAGLNFRVPEGWVAESGPMPFGTTALMPEDVSAENGAGGLVFIGALTPEMLGGQEVDNQQAAFSLATGIGQAVLPVPGEPVDQTMEEISTRAGDGWALSFRVMPLVEQNMLGPEGALIYSAVVGEGENRYWLVYIGSPADGSMSSPQADWAEQIVKRFRPA